MILIISCTDELNKAIEKMELELFGRYQAPSPVPSQYHATQPMQLPVC